MHIKVKKIIKKFVPEYFKRQYHYRFGEIPKLNNKAVDKIDLDNIAIFKSVEIETINRCNGLCSFCPVNAKEKQRPYAKMGGELYKKIISELKEIKYNGVLSLFSNNEPFLDDRIIGMYKYAHENVPLAELTIYTNGSLLTVDKLKAILPYIDKMIIDNYNDNIELNNNLIAIQGFVSSNEEATGKVHIDVRKQNEIRSSRGGNAPNKNNTKAIPVKCVLPFQQLVIRPDGKVSLCCNDALGNYTLGDCNNSTLIDIWTSLKYRKIREEMKKNGRKNLNLCKACDTLGGMF